MKTMKNNQTTAKTVRSLPQKLQRGVTLVELTIVLIIIGIIVSVLYTQIGGNTNTNEIRAANGFRHAKLVANAAALQQQALGCYPIRTLAMVQVAAFNLAAGNSCNADRTATAAQFPFIRGVEIVQGNNNEINLDDISDGAIGSLAEVAGEFIYYQINPGDDTLADAMMERCTGAAFTPADTGLADASAGSPCIYDLVAGAGNDIFGYHVGDE